MALLKKLHKLQFEPFVNEPPITVKIDGDIQARFGFPAVDYSYIEPGEDNNENLTVRVKISGYPTRVGRAGRRTQSEDSEWLLSQGSVESQLTIPLEVTKKDDNADVKSYRDVEKPDGQLWLFQGWVYFTDDQMGLEAEDVRALINVDANKRRLTLEKAHALQTMSEGLDKPKRRESIAQGVRVEVWQRDRGRCVECDSQEKLEFDHIIPIAMGGGNTSRNLQLLCESCNRRKGASLG